MVFALQEVGICVAKSRFLWCKSMVFVVRKYGFCGAKVWCFVGVRVYIAICLQRCFRPSAAVGDRFIVPAYMETHT